MSTPIIPETTPAEHYNIATPKGRSNLFKKRVEEMTKPKTEGGLGLTIDQAIFEMRTSANAADVALLAAMGDEPSRVRKEKLLQQKHSDFLTKTADENARATTPSPEVAAAMHATNSRCMAFNARIDELIARGFTLDEAIRQMGVNIEDVRLLASAAKLATNSRSMAFNARLDELIARGFTFDEAIRRMRVTDAPLIASMGG